MTAFICITCGSLVIAHPEDRIVLHPHNVPCASYDALKNGTLRLRRYLELSGKNLITDNPATVITP